MLDAMHSCHLSDFPSGLPLCIAPQHLRPRTESPKTPSTLAIIWPWAPKSAFLVTGTCTLPEGLLSYLVVYTMKLAIQRAKPWDASLRLGSLAHRQTFSAKTFDTGRAQPPPSPCSGQTPTSLPWVPFPIPIHLVRTGRVRGLHARHCTMRYRPIAARSCSSQNQAEQTLGKGKAPSRPQTIMCKEAFGTTVGRRFDVQPRQIQYIFRSHMQPFRHPPPFQPQHARDNGVVFDPAHPAARDSHEQSRHAKLLPSAPKASPHPSFWPGVAPTR